MQLLAHNVAGAAPGTPLTVIEATPNPARSGVFAVILWMLVDRTAPQENEDEILDLCCDLTGALDAEIAASEDEAALAQLFARYADMI